MTVPRLFVCGGITLAGRESLSEGRQLFHLNSTGKKPNVHIRFENVAKVFLQHLSPRLLDLLEIASYVYSADCAARRGQDWADDDSTEPWGRDLSFLIPVRDPAFWSVPGIGNLISEILGFLSNDKYSFTFVPLERDRAHQQEYLQFGDMEKWPFSRPDRVLMFSGGLDSLAGAVETATGGGHLVLVSHRPVSTIDARQRKLFGALCKLFSNRLVHIPVWINKKESLGREATQRTRSFLYSALGTVIAESVRAEGVRFYENGIVSLNFPLADEVLRARASRTTHPAALHLFSSLYSAVTEREFVVDNPYLFKTKAEVVATLAAHNAAKLIPYTCSCSHSMFQRKTQRHCGCCSQCIARRFAIAGAGLLSYDAESDYVSDVFSGPRKKPLEKAIAVDYTRHAIELDQHSDAQLAAIFNAEISRAVRYEPKRSDAARRVVSMHKRHGSAVSQVLKEKIAENAAELLSGTLDETCLLSLVIGRKSLHEKPVMHVGGNGDSSDQNRPSTVFDRTDGPPAWAREMCQTILAKFQSSAPKATPKRKKGQLGKRDTVIFAALHMELKGMEYCRFLDKHGLRTKWSEIGPGTYSTSYQRGHPWQKKAQDEKTRAKRRMNGYSDSELREAVNRYLPAEFDAITRLSHSRDSHCASKSLSLLKQA